MTGSNFTTAIVVGKTAAEAFDAINNVRGWWHGEIEGSAEKVGDEFSYRMKEIHYSKQRVTELIPNKKIVWHVIDSKLSAFKNKQEWIGTKIFFEITEIGNQTRINFTHDGLVPAFACYGDCSWAWGQLITESLFSFITTGKGIEVFN
jgi:hypothetical protein